MKEQGQRVLYKVGDLEGVAHIVGVASTGVPILGVTYILQDASDNFPNGLYHYTHFVCPELYLTDLEDYA